MPSNRWRKCGIHIQWNIIQSSKRKKSYHLCPHGWTLKTLSKISHAQKTNTTPSHVYVESKIVKLIEAESRTVIAGDWGEEGMGRCLSRARNKPNLNVDLSQTFVLDLGCLCCADFVHLHKIRRLLEEVCSGNALWWAYKDLFLLGLTTLILSLPSCRKPLKIS